MLGNLFFVGGNWLVLSAASTCCISDPCRHMWLEHQSWHLPNSL